MLNFFISNKILPGRVLYFFISIWLFLFIMIPARSQENLPVDSTVLTPLDSLSSDSTVEVEVIDTILSEEFPDTVLIAGPTLTLPNPWEIVSLQGKLKMQGLPLSPSLKLFMQKDSLISLSIRAPFIGEAGRLDISPDSIIVINKMKKTFVKEGYRRAMDSVGYSNLSLGDLQQLLLGQFFLPGIDLYEADLDQLIDIYQTNEADPDSVSSLFNIIPKGEAELKDVRYGFTVDALFRPLMLMILPLQMPDSEIDINYNFKLDGYDVQISYLDFHRDISLTLEFKKPEWSGQAPKPLDISKYRQLSFRDFLRNIQ